MMKIQFRELDHVAVGKPDPLEPRLLRGRVAFRVLLVVEGFRVTCQPAT